MTGPLPPVEGGTYWLIEAGIALLEGSRWLARGSLVLTGVSAFALATTSLPGVLQRVAAVAALGMGMVAAYLALRMTMDLVFFRVLRSQVNSLDAALPLLDAALRTLRWMPEAKAGRGVDRRVAGIERAVRLQAMVLLAQAVLIACVPWL